MVINITRRTYKKKYTKKNQKQTIKHNKQNNKLKSIYSRKKQINELEKAL